MNLLRGLIWNNEVSLTVVDTTALVNEGMRLHGLKEGYLFGKALSALAFFSASLKEQKGEVSLSLRLLDKELIGASGNSALRIRGYITEELACQNEQAERLLFADGGNFTLVRDDGYNRPFVGSCALPERGTLDEGVEEYFRISEQLPTRLTTVVEQNEGGRVAFSGVVALQPLPFAGEESLRKTAQADLDEILNRLKVEGLEGIEGTYFEGEAERREAVYKCNCSRDYLSAVLVTLGKGQLEEIVRAEGAVRVHCHYCNTDYAFTGEDVERLFSKEYERNQDEEN